MKQSFTRSLLVSMLMVFGLTTAWAQKSVLNESFTGKALPEGWTAGEYWDFTSGNAKFFAPFENGADTLITPLLDLSELDNVPSAKISYSLAANAGKVNEFKILYRASADAEWAEWKSFTEATDGQVTAKDALPAGLQNVQIAIAGAYKGGGDSRIYNLSVENKTEAANAPTGFRTEDLTTTSVTLYWDKCSSTKILQYNLKVSTKEMTDMSAEADVLDRVNWWVELDDEGKPVRFTNEFYELTGLTPNTEYWVYVQYDFGDGDLSPWAEFSFKTPCASIRAPYNEDFEQALSSCNIIISDGTSADASGEYAYNSQKSFKSNSAKGKYNYFILPEFDGEVKNFQVSFMAAAADGGDTYARTVTVGVCTGATAESFTEVKTLNLPKGRVWETIVVALKGYAGEGKYIAFRFGNEEKENRLFVDNIKIETASQCPKPMFVEVSEVTPTTAKLAWVETGDANEWNLVLSTKLLNDPEDIEPNAAKGEFAGSISANPYTASNLQPNTTYFAYLQAGCGSSEWTSAVEFKTSRPVLFPYSEHFDRMNPDKYTNDMNAVPDGWVMDCRNAHVGGTYYDQQPTATNYNTFVPYVVTSQNHESTAYVNAAMQLKGQSDGTGSTSANVGIAIMPAMPENVTIKDLMVTFWALSTNGTQTIAVGVAKNQDNGLQKGKQLGENITLVNTATIPANEWTKCKVLMKAYEGEGRYIVFSIVPPSTATPTIYIDDIEIDYAPDCNTVSTLSAEATGIDKATVTWTDASSSTSWTIKVSSTEIDPETQYGDKIPAQTVSSKSYNLTGLTMGGTYYIYVSPTCGDAWMSTSVTTLVGLQVPYYNDFTNETTGANATRGPKNWKLGYTYTDAPSATSSYYPYIYNTAYAAANNPPADAKAPYLYVYTGGTSASYQFPYAIMPELLNADVKDLKMSFYGYYNSTTTTANYAAKAGGPFGVLHIGVVNSPSDINKTNKFNNVTKVATVRCSKAQTVELFVVDFSSYTGNGKYIVFYEDTAKYNYFGIDNLTIARPSDPWPVSDVAASEIMETSVKLTWKENGLATKWEVRVFDAAQEDPAAGTPIWSNANLSSKEATITGLTHSTQYFAYVRSVQDNGNGAWGNASFWTQTGTWAVPFVETFNSYATGGTTNNTLPPYYDVSASLVADKNYPYVRAGSLSNAKAYDGNAFNFQTTSTNTLCQLLLPPLDKPINTLQMSMVASPYSSSASYINNGSYTQIGVVEGDGTFVEVAHLTISVNNVWTEWFVNFGSYSGPGGQIAIRQDYNASGAKVSTYLMMDQIVIEEIPLCGRVTSIDVTEIDSTSAKIAWEKGKTENAWNLKVSTKELADPSTETADAFDGKVAEQSKALTDLEGNTKYYVYVQSVDETLECTGKWSNATVFKTLCKLQTFPYEEDFQSYTTTGAGNLPDCSTICGQDADHSYILTKGTGNYALYINQKTKEHKNYFVFPALNTEDVRKLQLNMQVWVGSTATSTYRYQVGIMTDPNDPSTFVSLHNEELMGSSNPYDRSYKFDNYAGDETGTKFGGYIAISPRDYTTSSNGTGYTSMYIDNVSIDFIETCIKPIDLQTDSVGTYGAKLKWNTDDKTATHRVRIYDNPDAKPTSDGFILEKIVNDTVAIFESGLQALTKYYAYVRKECAANDLSKWSSAWAFKTDCPETRAIPYEEGFDGETAPLADYCWSSFMVQGPSGCTTDYKANSSTSAKKDGTRGLYLQYTEVPSQAGGNCVGTHRSAAITPELDVENLNELLLYFDVKASSTTKAGVKIEAVSDETISADAIYITTISDIGSTWQKAYIKLADYYTSVQPYKRLRFTSTTNTSVYIDNMVFTKDLNVVLPVEGLKLQMLTENSIKFSFTENTPTVNQWQVAYVAAGGDIADATVLTIDATEYTLTGLTTNTSYDIYVRGNVEGSAWVGPLTATTIQAPAPLPLITGFEDEADNAMWNMYNLYGDGIHTYPNFWIIGKADSCAGTGENALFITNDSASYLSYEKNDGVNMDPVKYAYQGSNITASSYVWATRNIKIDAAGTYKFAFKAKSPSTYSSSGLYAQLIPAGATFKAETATLISGATRSGKATTATDANGCYLAMSAVNSVADWTWYRQSLDVAEAGIYTLAIYCYNYSTGSSTTQHGAIDSVIVEEYLCTTPKNIEFTNRAANEVSLKWFGGKCKNFEYVLSRYANLGNPALIDETDKVAYGTLNEGPAITLSNLIPQTNYSFYIRTICPEGYTDWIEFDFVTPCGKYDLPYTEGFFETPECWILKSATQGKTSVGTSAEHEDWYRLLLNATSGYAILPELSVDLKNVEVEIGLFNTTTNFGAVSLGVMDNTYDIDTYEEVAFFQTQTKPGSTGTYTPTQLEVFNKMMNLYKGTGKVLAIKNATANAIGVKYVKLTELPDCVRPQQVELTFISENSVTVNWLAGVEEVWEIKINDSIIENVTTNPYKITGLEQGTVYEVSVRALCDAEHTSEWSLPAKFQTECAANALPLFEDFSGLAKPATTTDLRRAHLTCWNNMVSQGSIDQVFAGKELPFEPGSNVYAGDVWVSNWLTALGDYAQLHSYRRDAPTYRHKWFVSPQYAIEGKASLSFDIRCTNNAGNAPAPSSDRTIVAVSTDNGATWKAENATLITDIDSVYSTKSVSLDKFAGKTIRVAFYDENINSSHKMGQQPFVLIDNIRMNCTDEYLVEGNACQGYDYEGNGFTIKAEDLPMLGKDSTYYRFAANAENGCDSIIALKLTTHKDAEIAPVYATICKGEVYEFGGQNLTKPNPEGQPYYISGQTVYGCDSTIYLYLTVLDSDTTDKTPGAPIEIMNSDLPYEVDEYYTIPEDAKVGVKFDTVVKIPESCSFNKYSVTITRCVEEPEYSTTICEGEVGYIGYGFKLEKDDLPAPGKSKIYTRNAEHNGADICDSIVTLTLTVHKNDTTLYTDAICQSATNYEGNGFTLAQAELPAPGETLTFYRKESDKIGCDSIISLTLTVYKNDTTSFADAICQSETSYVGNGFNLTQTELPAPGETLTYYRKEQDGENGCDSIISLELTVQKYDTIVIPTVAVKYAALPYKVDDYYTIPLDAHVGDEFEVVVRLGETSCTFHKYTLFVSDCVRTADYTATICEDQTTFEDYGFTIYGADRPAAGTSNIFTRYSKDEQGCDSVITLTLAVLKGDTTIKQVAIQNIDLPYVVDEYYTVPADAAIGEPFVVTVKTDKGDCSFNTYEVMITKCEIPVAYDDAICSDQLTYEGYGFTLVQADLPVPGESKVYSRHALDEVGCDSVITFTLTVVKNDTTNVPVAIDNTQLPYKVDEFYTVPEGTTLGEPYELVIKTGDCMYNRYQVSVIQCTRTFRYAETLCEDQKSYEGYGFTVAEADMPAVGESKQFNRSNMNEVGCDSLITLTLFVIANDTIDVEVAKLNTQLPYVVDEYYTVPADAPIGETFEVVRKAGENGCSYNKYIITITQCEQPYAFFDIACPGENYEGYGFAIAAAELPAVGESKPFNRNAMNAEGCDSIITLTLTVKPTEISEVPVTIDNTQLPYKVDDYYTVPADAPIGETTEVIVKTAEGDCSYNKYIVTVSQCTLPVEFEDAICENQLSYEGYGFAIAATELPAAGETKPFNRNAMDEAGCDSIITLTLTVLKNDTVDHLPAYEIKLSELPIIVDGIEILSAETPVGDYSIVIPAENDECSFDRYFYSIVEDKDGLLYITDGLKDVTIYDALGHKVAMAADSSELGTLDLPSGVYMLRTTTQNGNAFCGKFIVK